MQLQERQEVHQKLFDTLWIPSDLWELLFSLEGVSSAQILHQKDIDLHRYHWKAVHRELVKETTWYRSTLLLHDSAYEHWNVENGFQLQAVFCTHCGNYAMSNTPHRSEKTYCSHW